MIEPSESHGTHTSEDLVARHGLQVDSRVASSARGFHAQKTSETRKFFKIIHKNSSRIHGIQKQIDIVRC